VRLCAERESLAVLQARAKAAVLPARSNLARLAPVQRERLAAAIRAQAIVAPQLGATLPFMRFRPPPSQGGGEPSK